MVKRQGKQYFRDKFKKAVELQEKLENIFKDIKVKKEEVILNFLKFKHFINNLSSAAGCKLARKTPLTPLEREIFESLRKINGCIVIPHTTLTNINENFVNVDFLIEKVGKKFIVEVTELNKCSRIIKSRIRQLDHKFRGLKLKDPNLVTVIFLKINGFERELLEDIRSKLMKEAFDTDFIILQHEMENLKGMVEDVT